MKKTKKKIFKTETTKKKITKNLPTKLAKKNTTDYYRCLCETSKGGIGNITQATKLCKANAPAITQARKEEVTKILVSLAKLLQH
ncbi:MAG: hypothetical protein mread185_000083 [Mycoplasmataceae bacterium]|nr:MAG: hypothetical protein mread185_000083 [Mycoplasmataceae bacterium]